MGVELPINGTSIQLETGVYVLKTECGTEKIIVNEKNKIVETQFIAS